MIRCSDASLLADEPLLGTAPVARSWIVLEQPGPWGAKALTDSHLDPHLGATLDKQATEHQARVALIRRPGHHADHGAAASFRLWIASSRPGASWLLGGWIASADVVGDLDWSAVEAGDRAAVAASMPWLDADPQPLLLVCTNGRRDVCCALRGRPLVEALRDRLPGRVWETTHLSGHRFAPTAVVLPYGVTYGRLTPDAALTIVDAAQAGRFVPDSYRGRSSFTRPAQAAEAAVRQAIDTDGLDAIDVASIVPATGEWRVEIVHQDGRRWTVDVRQQNGGQRPESCGAAHVPVTEYVAGAIRPVHR